jgi:hypothetical protein
MKTLLLLLLLIPAQLFSQNTAYLSLQPTDLGYGVRLENDSLKIYVSFSKGSYNISGGTIDQHLKVGIGKLFYLDKITFLSLGLAYHNYSGIEYFSEDEGGVNKNIFHPMDIEAGLGVKFRHLALAFRTGVIKWGDTVIEIGLKF